MKKILIILFSVIAFSLNAQVGYTGNAVGSGEITIDLNSTRFAFTENSNVVVTKQVGNFTFQTSLATFVANSCDLYITAVSKKKQGVLKKNQVFAINRVFIDKIIPSTGGCTVMTKDPAVVFVLSSDFEDFSNEFTNCTNGGGGGEVVHENGLYDDGAIKWGGDLVENTGITGDGHFVSFDGTSAFSIYNSVDNGDASSYFVMGTNLGIPSTLSHTDVSTGYTGVVSMDGDGYSVLQAIDDNQPWNATVSVQVVNPGVNLLAYGETYLSSIDIAEDISISTTNDVVIDAAQSIDISAAGIISIFTNSGETHVGNGNGEISWEPMTGLTPADGDLIGYTGSGFYTKVIAASSLPNFANTDLLFTWDRLHDVDNFSLIIKNAHEIYIGVGEPALNNIANGIGALKGITGGSNNIAFGLDALKNNIIGNDNQAIGSQALMNNSEGSNNIAIGSMSLLSSIGDSNISIGKGSGYETDGDQNILIGLSANTESGISNSVAIGAFATARASNVIVLGESGKHNVGIGTDEPNLSALLELKSFEQGFLPPRMTATQGSAITPVEGLMIYVTNTNGTFLVKGPHYYDGAAWIHF